MTGPGVTPSRGQEGCGGLGEGPRASLREGELGPGLQGRAAWGRWDPDPGEACSQVSLEGREGWSGGKGCFAVSG